MIKTIFKTIFCTAATVIILTTFVLAAPPSEGQTDMDLLKLQQTKAQVMLFDSALKEFGATSPDMVAELWAKADMTRNGVLKYAVACDSLKQKLIKEKGLPEDSYWIIGGSSPWLKNYVVYKKESVDKYTCKITMIYHWTTSAGENIPSVVNLVVVKSDDKWCVTESSGTYE